MTELKISNDCGKMAGATFGLAVWRFRITGTLVFEWLSKMFNKTIIVD
jgi:hypothetical protein